MGIWRSFCRSRGILVESFAYCFLLALVLVPAVAAVLTTSPLLLIRALGVVNSERQQYQ
jgi:hypothetical protein